MAARQWQGRRRRLASSSLAEQRRARVEAAFADASRAATWALEPGLQGDLPDPARRRRPHLGRRVSAATHCEVRPSPDPRARRRHRHRRVPPGWRCARGGCRGSTPSRSGGSAPAATSTWRSASRASSASRAAAPPLLRIAERRRPAGAAISTLIAGDGAEQVICLHGLGLEQGLVLRDGRRARARLHRPRDRPARASAPRPSRPAPPTTPPGSPTAVLRLPGRAGDRAGPPGRQLDGRPGRDRGRASTHPERVASLSLLAPAARLAAQRASSPRSCGCCGPSWPRSPTRCARRWCASQFWSLFAQPERLDPAAADVAVERVLPHATARAPPGSPSSPRRATSTSTSPTASAASGPGSRASSRRRCSSGATQDRARPGRASPATSPRRCPRPARWCSPSAATCPRSSSPSSTNGLIRRADRHRLGSGQRAAGAAARARRAPGAAARLSALGRRLSSAPMADPTTLGDRPQPQRLARRRAPTAERRSRPASAPLGAAARAGGAGVGRAGSGAARRRRGRRRRVAGGRASRVQSALTRRPRRPRPRLHPREPAARLAAGDALVPGRGPQHRQRPRERPGAAGRQPHRAAT